MQQSERQSFLLASVILWFTPQSFLDRWRAERRLCTVNVAFFFFLNKAAIFILLYFQTFQSFCTLLYPALAGGERAKLFFMHHRFYGVQIALGFHSVVIVTCCNNYR